MTLIVQESEPVAVPDAGQPPSTSLKLAPDYQKMQRHTGLKRGQKREVLASSAAYLIAHECAQPKPPVVVREPSQVPPVFIFFLKIPSIPTPFHRRRGVLNGGWNSVDGDLAL